jgi:hypothetical protein
MRLVIPFVFYFFYFLTDASEFPSTELYFPCVFLSNERSEVRAGAFKKVG